MFTDNRVWCCILTILISKSMCSTIERYMRQVTFNGPVTLNYYRLIPNFSLCRCSMTCWTLFNWDQIYFYGKDCYCLAPVYEKADKVSGTVTADVEFWTTYHDVTSCSVKGYTPFLNQRYCLKYYSYGESWYHDESTCRQDGGHLISVYTNDDLVNLRSVGGGNVYIGAHRTSNGTEFAWITGETVYEWFWEPGERSNNEGKENCVLVLTGSDKFANSDCDYPMPYICQLLMF